MSEKSKFQIKDEKRKLMQEKIKKFFLDEREEDRLAARTFNDE